MVVALLDSFNYEWMALGRSEKEAKEAIKSKWNEHQKDISKQDPEYTPVLYKSTDKMEEDWGIWVEEIDPGQCIYR